MGIRKAVYAGMFYPKTALDLQSSISEFLDEVPTLSVAGNLKAVVAPHAGYVYSGPTAAYSFSLLKKLDRKKDWKVLILGPSHHKLFHGASVSPDDIWETPFGQVSARDLRDECKSDLLICDDEAHLEEHSLEVEVPFLQMVLKKFSIYPLCLGDVNPKKLAAAIGNFCARDDVIIVVSSDLSHYLPYKQAKEVDDVANKAIPAIDIATVLSNVEACGITGILTLLYVAKDLKWKGHFLNYQNSGDTAGEKFQVVGYGAYAFTSKK